MPETENNGDVNIAKIAKEIAEVKARLDDICKVVKTVDSRLYRLACDFYTERGRILMLAAVLSLVLSAIVGLAVKSITP